LVLAGVIVVAVGIGSTWLPPMTVARAVFGAADPASNLIVQGVRLPAALLAAIAGAALATSGATMQALLRNPLADPFILGISGGAGLGTVLVAGLSTDPGPWLPAAAAAGALTSTLLLLAIAARLADRPSQSQQSLLLAGVMLNAFCGSGMLITQAFIDPDRHQQLLHWLLGTIDPMRIPAVGWAISIVCICATVCWMIATSHKFNLLALGDTESHSLGIRPDHLRRSAMLVAALCTAGAVCWTGLIGFVGLIAPHAVRRFVGDDQRYVIALSAPAGAAALVLADALSRQAFAVLGTSLPTGAITAVVGAPLFVWLLLRTQGAVGGAR
jgi:iron complex transport system permease protein